jgi:hypothetical protein
MFQIFVRFKSDGSEFALWPVMQDYRTKEVYVGSVIEQYPTTFTKRTVGPALVRLYKKFEKGRQLDRVEVRPAIDYDAIDNTSKGSGQRSSPGYSEACGQYN